MWIFEGACFTLTIQAFIFLIRARRIQTKENEDLYYSDDLRQFQETHEKGQPFKSFRVKKDIQQMEPMLLYLKKKGLVVYKRGINYIRLTHAGYYYVQTILCSIARFAVSSIAVPVAVSLVTTLVTLWVKSLMG